MTKIFLCCIYFHVHDMTFMTLCVCLCSADQGITPFRITQITLLKDGKIVRASEFHRHTGD